MTHIGIGHLMVDANIQGYCRALFRYRTKEKNLRYLFANQFFAASTTSEAN
jgi:hypothetical protein